jgi:hypothetical protein
MWSSRGPPWASGRHLSRRGSNNSSSSSLPPTSRGVGVVAGVAAVGRPQQQPQGVVGAGAGVAGWTAGSLPAGQPPDPVPPVTWGVPPRLAPLPGVPLLVPALPGVPLLVPPLPGVPLLVPPLLGGLLVAAQVLGWRLRVPPQRGARQQAPPGRGELPLAPPMLAGRPLAAPLLGGLLLGTPPQEPSPCPPRALAQSQPPLHGLSAPRGVAAARL